MQCLLLTHISITPVSDIQAARIVIRELMSIFGCVMIAFFQ